jgi:cell division protein FtsI/penicillin-binding protein 2
MAVAGDEPVLGEAAFDPGLGRYVAPYGEGRAVLTLIPALQAKLERYLMDYRVPWGVTVLMEPTTGRILALAEYSERNPRGRGFAFKAMAPAASVFKIVTAAALLGRGIPADQQVCFHGGRHGLNVGLLEDNPRLDQDCLGLSDALGQSANVVFAKLADRELTSDLLVAEAERFLFNTPIPFVRPVEVSTARIPSDRFPFANTAAGFGAVKLSPLHGAVLTATIANWGLFVPPDMIASVEGVDRPELPQPRRLFSEETAEALADMMGVTCTEGTAAPYFPPSEILRKIPIAGKTGTLADKGRQFREYTWFVGFAPANQPKIVVATLVINHKAWKVRAATVAYEALKIYFGNRRAWEAAAAAPVTTLRAP